MIVRRVARDESAAVCRLIEAITKEVYGLPYAEEDWTGGWVGVEHGSIIGMVKTFDDRVEDLWIVGGLRGRGSGARLLAHAEQEIRDRGHRLARLRVVAANERARGFYRREGWREHHTLVHEHLGIEMIEMEKPLS